MYSGTASGTGNMVMAKTTRHYTQYHSFSSMHMHIPDDHFYGETQPDLIGLGKMDVPKGPETKQEVFPFARFY